MNWAPYKPNDSAPWDIERVVHLHRRVAFAATWPEIERDLREGPEAAVTRLLEGKARSEGVPAEFEQLAAIIGQAAVDSGSAERLKAWWLYRCLFTPHPLQERLVLMWHNHFATSNLKVDDLRMMKRQNEAFRRHALAPFGKLLADMVRDPALLKFLDAPANRKEQPNENLARELMELFTLGIGHYSEEDVKQAARALTGWTVRQGDFYENASAHDEGEKTLFGRAGNWGGDDLAKMLLDNPAMARRLAWRLCGEFCGDGVVADAALAELAEGLRHHNLDIRWGLETILRSELFFSRANIGSRVCEPVSFLIGPLRALECWRDPPSTLVLAEWVRRMGEDLFYPPNVGGWNGGRSWLSTRAVIARSNAMAALVTGELHSPVRPPDVVALAGRYIESRDPADVVGFLSKLMFGRVEDDSLRSLPSAGEGATLGPAVITLLTSPRAQLH